MPSFRAKKRLFVSCGLIMGLLGIAAVAYPFQFPLEAKNLVAESKNPERRQETRAISQPVVIPANLLNKTLQGKIPEPPSETTSAKETPKAVIASEPVVVAPSIIPLEMIGSSQNQVVVFQAPDGRKAVGSVGQVIFKASPMKCQIKQLDMKNKRILVLFQGVEHWLSLNKPLGNEPRSNEPEATGR